LKVTIVEIESPNLKGLPEKYREHVINSISTNVSLSIAAPIISDSNYWKRRSKERFQLASVCDHGNDWKRLYFELYLQSEIEKLVPSSDIGIMQDQIVQLKETLQLAAPFVQNLKLRQLRPMNVVPQPDDLDREMANTKTPGTPSTRTLDHLDLGLVISCLQQLKQVNVYYG
jgi:hypothetical protein